MSDHADKSHCCPTFYGSVTVGERGQIVIPAEARSELGFQPGDKLLVLKDPFHEGISIFKIEAVRDFLDEFQRKLEIAAQAESEE